MRLPTSRIPHRIWGRSERPYRLGLLGVFIGFLALLAATQFQFDWLSQERQAATSGAAVQAQTQAQAKAGRIISLQWGERGSVSISRSPATVATAPSPQVATGPHPVWNWAAKALGALAVLLALAAWWKQEDWRPVLLAFVLGLTGIAFQGMYMLASAALLVAVVLMALSAAFS